MSIGFEAGASFFLYKPIEKEGVLKLVRATQGMAEPQRRRLRRVPVIQKVMLRCGKEEIEAETVDMSLSGMLVKSARTFPLGSSLRRSRALPKTPAYYTPCPSCAWLARIKWERHVRLRPTEEDARKNFSSP
jgi:c-di-GMP-binding flagellar brake protein YcgR